MKHKQFIIVLLSLFILSGLAAQIAIKGQLDVGGTGDDFFLKSAPAKDGSVYVAGYSYSNHSKYKTQNSKGGYDYWVTKFAINAATGKATRIWDKTIGGDNEDKLVTCVATSDNGCLLAGTSRSGISGDKTDAGNGLYNAWLVKLDKNGNKEWDNTYTNLGVSWLEQTSDAGYILLSGSRSVAKLNTTGGIEWHKDTFGLSNALYYSSITQTTDGGYIMGGSSGIGAVLSKTDALGNMLWTKQYGARHQNVEIGNYAAHITSDNGIIISGIYADYDGEFDTPFDFYAQLVKTDAAGNAQWSNDQYIDYYTGFYNTLSPTADGNYILGYGTYDYIYEKIDHAGNISWTDTLKGTGYDNIVDILPLNNNRYLLAGNSTSGIGSDKTVPNLGGTDFWLVAFTDITGSSLLATQTVAFALITKDANDVQVYPNPVKDILHVQVKGNAIFTLKDQRGKVILTTNINNIGNINVAHLPSGIYYLQNNATGAVKKIIVVK